MNRNLYDTDILEWSEQQANKRTLLLRHAWALLFLLLPILAGCSPPPTAAQREATVRAASDQFVACKRAVLARPQFAPLLPHLGDPATGQFSAAQMTNETRPTPQEAALITSWYDATNDCARPLMTTLRSQRPDLAVIAGNLRAAESQLTAQLVERQISWARYARELQHINSEGNAQIAAANQRWNIDHPPYAP